MHSHSNKALTVSCNPYLVSSFNCLVVASLLTESAKAIFNLTSHFTHFLCLSFIHTHLHILVLLLCSLFSWTRAKVSIQSIHVCDNALQSHGWYCNLCQTVLVLFWETRQMSFFSQQETRDGVLTTVL